MQNGLSGGEAVAAVSIFTMRPPPGAAIKHRPSEQLTVCCIVELGSAAL